MRQGARPPRKSLLLASAALAFFLGGCGGGDSSSIETTPTPTPTETATPTPSPTPTPTSTSTGSGDYDTSEADCPYSGNYAGDYSAAGTLTAEWGWTCSSTERLLTGNGLPDHPVGTFPSSGNPNTISVQSISASMTLTPVLSDTATDLGGPDGTIAYARNSVKFDPATAGSCPADATQASDCDLADPSGNWHLEALGQDVFDFGADDNNAHVQPGGIYHYHGIPEGMLDNAGVTASDPKMVLVGWAADGFPVYARYCYTDPDDADSAVKVCKSSYVLDSTPDADRPSIDWVPLGAFESDWSYSEGSGDLDECNGRTGATPEFPDGIYYYMATDTYPYFSRCVKGEL